MRRFVVGDEDNLFGIDEDREHENGQSRANLKVPPPIKTIDIHFRERKEVVVVVQKDVKKSRTFSPSGNPGRVLLTNVITSAPPMAISDRAPMMMIDDDGWITKKMEREGIWGGGVFCVSSLSFDI